MTRRESRQSEAGSRAGGARGGQGRGRETGGRQRGRGEARGGVGVGALVVHSGSFHFIYVIYMFDIALRSGSQMSIHRQVLGDTLQSAARMARAPMAHLTRHPVAFSQRKSACPYPAHPPARQRRPRAAPATATRARQGSRHHGTRRIAVAHHHRGLTGRIRRSARRRLTLAGRPRPRPRLRVRRRATTTARLRSSTGCRYSFFAFGCARAGTYASISGSTFGSTHVLYVCCTEYATSAGPSQ